MKALLFLLPVLLLASCVDRPSIVRTADGTFIARMGGSLLADVGPIAGRIKTREGDEITFMSEREDGTSVANTGLSMYGLAKAAESAAVTTRQANTLKTSEVLGAQKADVAKSVSGDKLKAVGTAAGAGAEFAPVQVTAP